MNCQFAMSLAHIPLRKHILCYNFYNSTTKYIHNNKTKIKKDHEGILPLCTYNFRNPILLCMIIVLVYKKYTVMRCLIFQVFLTSQA